MKHYYTSFLCALVLSSTMVGAQENADLERDIIDDEGIITAAMHPDEFLLEFNFPTRLRTRLMSVRGTLDEFFESVTRAEENDDGFLYQAGVSTSGAFARSAARMTTLHDYNDATREALEVSGFDVDDPSFRIALSQYNFVRNELIRYAVAQAIWLEDPRNNPNNMTDKEVFEAVEAMKNSDDPDVKARVDSDMQLYQDAIVSITRDRLFSESPEIQLSEEAAYHFAYSVFAASVAERSGSAAPTFANALFDPVRMNNPNLELIERISLTLDNGEIIGITERGFGNDDAEPFTIGVNDQGLPDDMVIPENWALAAAAFADARTNLQVLFPGRAFSVALVD